MGRAPRLEGLTLTTRGIYSSSQYLDQANAKEIGAWNRIDVGARYAFKVDDKHITLRANVETSPINATGARRARRTTANRG